LVKYISLRNFPLILFVFLFAQSSFAQNQYLIDSLKAELKNHETRNLDLRSSEGLGFDTTKANILYSLSVAYWNNDLKIAEDFARELLSESEKINYKPGIANAYNSLGSINDNKGDFYLALEFYNKALKIMEGINDKNGIAKLYNNIGTLYNRQNKYEDALQNHLMSLKIKEELGLKNGIAISALNIGNIYFNIGNYPKALEYYLQTLEISEETGDKHLKSVIYTNIAGINLKEKHFAEALKNYSMSLEIQKEEGDQLGISNTYLNLGALGFEQNQFSNALVNYNNALKIKLGLQDKVNIALLYNNIGKVYFKEKKYKEAEKYLNLGSKIGNEINSIEIKEQSAQVLAEVYYNQGKYKDSKDKYELYISFRDSILNNEKTKKITELQLEFDFAKKESLAKLEQEKKDAITEAELKRNKQQRYFLFAGLLMAIVFSYIDSRKKKKIRLAKKTIEIEKKRSDELLLNILPSEVAEELKAKGSANAKQFNEVTVMFTDFKGFTQISEKLSPTELVAEIHSCFKAFDEIISRHNIEKIKTIGDSYMCAGGLPVANTTNANDVVSAALEIQQFMQEHFQKRKREGKEIFEIRIGIHTGPVVAGIVGVKKFAYDIWGDTVNIASRMESSGEAGKVNISGATYELVKEKFNFIHRGKIQAKNKGEIDMYFVEQKH
jgi:adenylate cyclase